jgi:hypothetical protein
MLGATRLARPSSPSGWQRPPCVPQNMRTKTRSTPPRLQPSLKKRPQARSAQRPPRGKLPKTPRSSLRRGARSPPTLTRRRRMLGVLSQRPGSSTTTPRRMPVRTMRATARIASPGSPRQVRLPSHSRIPRSAPVIRPPVRASPPTLSSPAVAGAVLLIGPRSLIAVQASPRHSAFGTLITTPGLEGRQILVPQAVELDEQ